ncbi:MAG: superoxide dismutase [Oscillospiraceae bacterium]|nr:superoxide dismutase [Oscillospiraceae bacterium]
MKSTYEFLQIPLPYSPAALEPGMSSRLISAHYTDCLGAHVDKLNAVLAPYKTYHRATLRELIMFSPRLPDKIRRDVRYHAGAVFHHNMFFYGMTPDSQGAPFKALSTAAKKSFASFDDVLRGMRAAATSLHGSGWVVLAADSTGRLRIVPCPNNETTLVMGMTPVLVLDMWEHAYCSQYSNNIDAYFDAWVKSINYHFAEEILISLNKH